MDFKTKIEKLDTKEIVNSEYINWGYFKNSTILITGATGLIGSQIVRSVLYANEIKGLNIKIIALVRKKKKAKNIFGANKIKYIVQDIERPIKSNFYPDFIIHTANSTSSKEFTEEPVETINSIITGTKNILDFARQKKIKSLIYLSSMEVYGKTDFDKIEPLKESDYGYIDILNTRNSYPEGKRLAECMCYSYAKEYNVPLKIARLCQTIGAGVDINDSRVFAQFARNIVLREDLVLKTKGETIRSYCYITDIVSAIFALLEKGKNGESYNVANSDTTCSIKEMAEMLTKKYTSSKLKFELDEKYYPKPSKLYLDTTKIKTDTNWSAKINLEEMFDRLIQDFYLRPKKFIFNLKFKNSIIKKVLSRIFSIGMTDNNGIKMVKILGVPFYIRKKMQYRDICKNTEVKPNKIVFEDKFGSGFGGNLKYIVEEIIKQKLPYELVWLDYKGVVDYKFPKEMRIVQAETNEAIEELASAKIWIGTQRKLWAVKKGLIKKEGQIYIQTWHGSLGIKKVGSDIHPLEDEGWENRGKYEASMLDYAISNSDFETNVYRSAFWGQGKTVLLGHARNDVYFKDMTSTKNKVYDFYNIQTDKKLILYAPTFRDDYDFTPYNMDYLSVIRAFEEKFGEEFVIGIRMHPEMKQYADRFIPKSEKIIDMTNYDDIQDLMVSSEALITDYSSCIFDFMLTRRPAFIYAPDIEKFNNNRGFYYPLETTPFPIGVNNEEFCKNITVFDYETYKQKVEEFLEEKGCMDDGHASERIVKFIKELMEK